MKYRLLHRLAVISISSCFISLLLLPNTRAIPQWCPPDLTLFAHLQVTSVRSQHTNTTFMATLLGPEGYIVLIQTPFTKGTLPRLAAGLTKSELWIWENRILLRERPDFTHGWYGTAGTSFGAFDGIGPEFLQQCLFGDSLAGKASPAKQKLWRFQKGPDGKLVPRKWISKVVLTNKTSKPLVIYRKVTFYPALFLRTNLYIPDSIDIAYYINSLNSPPSEQTTITILDTQKVDLHTIPQLKVEGGKINLTVPRISLPVSVVIDARNGLQFYRRTEAGKMKECSAEEAFTWLPPVGRHFRIRMWVVVTFYWAKVIGAILAPIIAGILLFELFRRHVVLNRNQRR